MAKLFANDTIGPSYAAQLRKEHDGSKWGSTGAKYSGSAIAELLRTRPYIETALDYGCGKGTVAQAFSDVDWVEYDPGIPGKDKKPYGEFDLVTCTDVLEHVEPPLVDGVLRELGAYTRKILFLDVACYPTGKLFAEGPYAGQDLHLLVQPPEEWIKAARLTGLSTQETRIIGKRKKGKWCERVQIILERV